MKKILLVVATLATVAVSTAGINGALRLYGIKFVRLPIARTAPAMA